MRTSVEVQQLSKEAATMYTGGLTDVSDIANELGVSVPYAYSLLKRAGITPERKTGTLEALTQEKKDELILAFKNGTPPIIELLRRAGLSYTMFYRLLINEGVDIPTYRNLNKEANTLRLDTAVRMYRDGAPITAIEAATGVRQPQLHRALKATGVPLRRSHMQAKKLEDNIEWVKSGDAVDPEP